MSLFSVIHKTSGAHTKWPNYVKKTWIKITVTNEVTIYQQLNVSTLNSGEGLTPLCESTQ